MLLCFIEMDVTMHSFLSYIQEDWAVFPKCVTPHRNIFRLSRNVSNSTGVTYIKPNISVRQLVVERSMYL